MERPNRVLAGDSAREPTVRTARPKIRAMLFAPLPPPVGGITSITAMLHRELGATNEVVFLQPVAKTTTWKRVVRPFLSLARLIRGTLYVPAGGRVVFFCSSRASFWDKCVWASVVLLLRRTVVMVMVAGDFPEAFAAAPAIARVFAHWLLRRRGIIVAAQSASWMAIYRRIFPHTIVTEIGATVEREFFQDYDRSSPPQSVVTLLFVGWVIPDKGVFDLLDALELIGTWVDGRARVRIVGPTFGREEFWRAEIERRGIGGIVALVGAVTNRAEILREYHDADAFVFPSHYEGFPVAMLEATAAGLLCIASDVGGVADILDGGRTGMVVPPKCPEKLAAAIKRAVSDAALRESLGAAAAEHTRSAFSLESCVTSYERVLGLR